MQVFCERLKTARIAKKMTQTEMANTIGMKLRGYQSYESGEREPNLEKLAHICTLLDVSADYLLGLVGKSDDPTRH